MLFNVIFGAAAPIHVVLTVTATGCLLAQWCLEMHGDRGLVTSLMKVNDRLENPLFEFYVYQMKELL